MIFAPAILASAAIDSDCADTVPGLRTTMYWFGILSVVAVVVVVAVAACIPTKLDCIDGFLLLWLFDSDCCSCSCGCWPISDPVIVPNGSKADSGGVGDDVSDGVASRNGGLFCSSSSFGNKAIAFGMSNNDDLWNMGEYDMAVAMIKKVNAETEIKNLFT